MNRDLLQYSFKAQAPDVIIVCDDKNKYPFIITLGYLFYYDKKIVTPGACMCFKALYKTDTFYWSPHNKK